MIPNSKSLTIQKINDALVVEGVSLKLCEFGPHLIFRTSDDHIARHTPAYDRFGLKSMGLQNWINAARCLESQQLI
jgi:hypothetical protein